MPPTIDPDSLGFLLTDSARLFRAEYGRRVADAGVGLTSGESRTLVHAARAGSVRQSVLAERMGVEAMTLSGYLDSLERLGMIERRADPDDRRAKRVHLTGKGEEMLLRMAPVGVAVRGDAMRGLTHPDRERLVEMLRLVRDNLSALREANLAGGADPA
jgi:DNA-binding MarR family transcriptional regulator